MPERILILNFGERDLYYNTGTSDHPSFWHFEQGKPGIERIAESLSCRPWARSAGQEIHRRLTADFRSEAKRCALPILEAVLSLITESAPLDRLILVGTDQDEATDPRYRDRDTIFSAKIAKRIVESTQHASVRLVELAYYRKAPLRDESYAFFGEFLSPLAARSAELHVCLSGSIPALNAALQEQAFRLFRGQHCYLYEVAEDRPTGPASTPHSTARLVPPQPFLRDFVADMIERLLNRFDYSGALDLLHGYQNTMVLDPRVESLLAYAERRANLDFEGAAKVLPRNDPFLLGRRQRTDAVQWALDTLAIVEARQATREYPEVAWRIRAVMDVASEHVPTPSPDNPASALPYQLINGKEARRYRSLVKRMLHFGGQVQAQQLEGAVPFLRRLIESWMRAVGREPRTENLYVALNDTISRLLRESSVRRD